jgi:hypothetical protein
MSEHTILLGYELGTGRAVEIPVRHMAVTGITQESGKTTTLEALIGRSGLRAVTFVTKRGESAFREYPRIPAYFCEHCDWQFVSSLLESYLDEKVKAERLFIMRACEDASSLRDVQYNIRGMLFLAKAGAEETVYYVLNEYFKGLMPEIERLPTSEKLELLPGINVIDVSEYSTHLQALVVSSVMEWIAEHENDVITLIPEAWEFIPRAHCSPCKTAAIRLARKGACAGNYVWIDSQDLASVDIEVRKMCSVYLLGVQREKNEVARTITHIPDGNKRPSAAQVMQLDRGWFYTSFGRELYCSYVQPSWLDADPERARKYAKYPQPAEYVAKPKAAKRAKKARVQ